jgi:hypothetical protein
MDFVDNNGDNISLVLPSYLRKDNLCSILMSLSSNSFSWQSGIPLPRIGDFRIGPKEGFKSWQMYAIWFVQCLVMWLRFTAQTWYYKGNPNPARLGLGKLKAPIPQRTEHRQTRTKKRVKDTDRSSIYKPQLQSDNIACEWDIGKSNRVFHSRIRNCSKPSENRPLSTLELYYRYETLSERGWNHDEFDRELIAYKV